LKPQIFLGQSLFTIILEQPLSALFSPPVTLQGPLPTSILCKLRAHKSKGKVVTSHHSSLMSPTPHSVPKTFCTSTESSSASSLSISAIQSQPYAIHCLGSKNTLKSQPRGKKISRCAGQPCRCFCNWVLAQGSTY